MSIMSMQRKNTERSKITQEQLINWGRTEVIFPSQEATIQLGNRIIQVSSERHGAAKLSTHAQARNNNEREGHLTLSCFLRA